MALSPFKLMCLTWEIVGVFWLIGVGFSKKAVRTQPAGWRLLEVGLGMSGFVLLGGYWLQPQWLQDPFFAGMPPSLQWTGLAVTLLGCSLAVWARIILGLNWSGRPSVQAGHELITTGPYRLARHPIYTGFLTALAGTVVVVGLWRALAGFAVLVLVFLLKIRQEETLMMQTFPEAYPRYRQQVKALIPGVL